jgi:uncharacterized protein YndB with AHSA1/START domain
MTSSLHDLVTGTFPPMLRSLSGWLGKAMQHAAAGRVDADALVKARLAPDMYSLDQQVSLACKYALDAVVELAGARPSNVDQADKTLEDLKLRIARTLADLEGAKEAAFRGAESRRIILPGPGILVFDMSGFEFVRDWCLPHFYFHHVTAYDIMRHSGVPIGKMDYLSHAGAYLRPSQESERRERQTGMINPAGVSIDASSFKEAVIIMTRTFDAPREKVWEAFTKPEHVRHWYGGHGFTNPVCEMDVRPGGLWRHVMRTPDGQEFRQEFVFLEVVKPEKLVWQSVDHGKGLPGPPSPVMTVTFEEHGRQTRWKLVARFDSISERDRAAAMGFAEMVGQGTEKFAHLVQKL